MPRLPRLTAKEIERAILRAGFVYEGSTGSHRQYRHPASKRMATIPFHSGIVAPKTFKSILNQTSLSIEAFLKLL